MLALTWNVDPEILSLTIPGLGWHFGPRYYGLLFALAFLVGYHIVQWMFEREGKSIESLSSLLFHLMMGTIIGARLGHCLFYEPDYYLANPLRILEIWKGGLASHGGTIGILVALALYARKNTDQPLGWLMDRLTVSVALTAACIRLGNFFNSEIVGKPTELPWAIVFERLDQIPRHPAMLYESVSYFVLCGVCFYLYATRIDTLKRGFLTGLLLVWIFTSRFLLEFVKENQVAFESGLPLNMGQLLSLPFVALGILFLLGKQAPFIDWMAPRPAGKKAAQHLPKAAKKSSKKKR